MQSPGTHQQGRSLQFLYDLIVRGELGQLRKRFLDSPKDDYDYSRYDEEADAWIVVDFDPELGKDVSSVYRWDAKVHDMLMPKFDKALGLMERDLVGAGSDEALLIVGSYYRGQLNRYKGELISTYDERTRSQVELCITRLIEELDDLVRFARGSFPIGPVLEQAAADRGRTPESDKRVHHLQNKPWILKRYDAYKDSNLSVTGIIDRIYDEYAEHFKEEPPSTSTIRRYLGLKKS